MRPRGLLLYALAGLCAFAPAQIRERAPSGVRITYSCRDKGRYTAQYNDGQKHYCFDGTHYTEGTLPADARQFFDNMAAELEEVRAHFASRPSSGAAPVGRSRQASAGAGVAASNRPVPKAVPLSEVKTIAPGQAVSEVVAKLGQPGGRMTGLADGEERWSYSLREGGTARVRIKGDQVVAVQLP